MPKWFGLTLRERGVGRRGRRRTATRREMGFPNFLAANVPRFSANKGLQISRAVDDSKNEEGVVFYEIDDPIVSDNHFSKILLIELGNNTSMRGFVRSVLWIQRRDRRR